MKTATIIYLIQNIQDYNNDIRAMLMAFYPGVRIAENPEDVCEIEFTFQACFADGKTVLHIFNGFEKTGDAISTEIAGDYKDKAIFRNILKRGLYKIMVQYTKRTLPWGDLTGVRPTKIAMAKLKSGDDIDAAVKNYENEYLVSRKKAVLASKVAARELLLTKELDLNKDYCLYLGIPFCPSRCLYCSFTSYPISVYRDKAVRYVECLKKELKFIADAYKDKRLTAIYMGGGTPTSIDHALLDDLLSHVNQTFTNLTHLREFTVEAGRPDSITKEKLLVMKNHGVTRISINPQTMNDWTLKTIGRAHTAEQAGKAFALARECGFDNINMDIIAGLPGEALDDMRHTLDEIETFMPESITVHSLAIKRAANLKQQMGEFKESTNKDMDAMLDMAADYAERLSMEPYYLYRQKNIGGNLENVGYAKPGFECLYNMLIMEELTDIIAAGAGASTKLTFHAENRVERIENCKSVDDYIDRFDEMLQRKSCLMA